MTAKEAQQVFIEYLKTGIVPDPAKLHYAAQTAIDALSAIGESECGEDNREEFVGVKESPLKTFLRRHQDASYRH